MTTMSNLKRVDDAAVARACAVDDFDDAIRPLVDLAGIDSGDVAAQVFSGFDDVNERWRVGSRADRETMLRGWLEVEALYAEDAR